MKKITVDFESASVTADDGPPVPMASDQGFALVSRAWLRAGWDAKYVYSFTWMGRPIIQLPDDMVRLQEVIWTLRPTVIVETGIAHGGSLIFSASLLKQLGAGRVIGVDIEIRPHNRKAIEAHALAPLITLIEGSSVDAGIVSSVKKLLKSDDKVLVLLDSNHTKAHVAAELSAYAPMVTPGSYIVAMDGIMKDVVGAPRTQPTWTWDNPVSAIEEFVASHPEFENVEPAFAFNEGLATSRVTYWPRAYLRRK